MRTSGLSFHQDLDARLVFVVATAVAVVDPQDGLEVSKHVFARQEAHHRADDRRAAQAAADQTRKPVSRPVVDQIQADVVHLDCGAVFVRAPLTAILNLRGR
jgi:hypothetical protein